MMNIFALFNRCYTREPQSAPKMFKQYSRVLQMLENISSCRSEIPSDIDWA